MKAGRFLRKNLPVILTAIGTVGVVATAVLTAKATPKAMDILEDYKDDDLQSKVVAVAPTYAVPVAVGVLTVTCVISAQVINQKRIGRLAASYAALGGLYTRYRDKVKEKLGEIEERQLNKEVRNEIISDMEQGVEWYKDPITGEIWGTTPEHFYQAQLDINEEFISTGGACFGDFLRYANAPKKIWNSRSAQYRLWNIDDTQKNDIYYIRMNTVDTDDMHNGRRVKEIIYNVEPLIYDGDEQEVYSTLGYS